MIPLILRTCLRVSTPTTVSASSGPDAYPLVFTVNMLYLHASPSPTPAFCVCVPSVSLSSAFLPLSLFCASSRGNLRCLLLDVPCLRDSVSCYCDSQRASNARSSLPYQRTKDAAIGDDPLFGSDLRSAVWHSWAWHQRGVYFGL